MCHVVLFHSALGARPAVHTAADRLRAAGHEVTVPDLYGGRTFSGGEAGYDAGTGLAREIGWQALLDGARDAVDGLPDRLVYAGFSMGAGIAQTLAGSRPGARGALLVAGGGTEEESGGGTPWPGDVPVEVHHAVDDPWVDAGAPERLVRTAARAGAQCAHHLYPGGSHLFMDHGLSDEYDPDSAELMWQRALAFLARVR